MTSRVDQPLFVRYSAYIFKVRCNNLVRLRGKLVHSNDSDNDDEMMMMMLTRSINRSVNQYSFNRSCLAGHSGLAVACLSAV